MPYKHKSSGLLANKTTFGYQIEGESRYLLPFNIVEQSSEWELINGFPTIDGETVEIGEEVYCLVVDRKTGYLKLNSFNEKVCQKLYEETGVRVFKHKENAIQYLRKCYPNYFCTFKNTSFKLGETFYAVKKGDKKVETFFINSPDFKMNPFIYDFATTNKEEAYEYMLLNVRCLSINDIAQVYKTANRKTFKGFDRQATELIELVSNLIQ